MTLRPGWLALLTAAGALSCAPTDGTLARYHLEQRLWHAQFFERRINISFMRASQNDTRLAIGAFKGVLADDPLSAPRASTWNADVVADIRHIQLSSRIALANLLFLSERYVDAGTMYRQTVETAKLSLPDELAVRLGAARAMYMAGESGSALEECAHIFRQIVDSPDFWAGRVELGDAFIDIPVALVRMYRENGDSASYHEYSGLAADFYDRVAKTWPDSSLGTQAGLGRIQLQMVLGHWGSAAHLLDAALAHAPAAQNAAGLELLQGEIYAFALRDDTAARRVLGDVMQKYPRADADFAARYDLAALRLQDGDETHALEDFRALEEVPGAPAAVASRATLARARILERRDDWDDAIELLRRLQELFPFTSAALEAPIVIVKHYVDSGQKDLAEHSLERAREYYLSLMDRRSRFSGDRMMVQGALATSYVLTGRAGDVAHLLSSPSAQWDDDATAAGLLKAADLYASVLKDTTQCIEMLKKCVERFPETRYSRVAQHRLNQLEGRP